MRRNFTRLLIVFFPALFCLLTAFATEALASNLLSNGNFAAGVQGWNGANSPQCSGGVPSIGGWQANALNFSYITNTVSQSVTIATPSVVTFSYTVQDRPEPWINGGYQVVVQDSNESYYSGWSIAPDQATTFYHTVETTSANEVVTVYITGSDNGLYWAGCYGPTFTNASLVATPVAPPLPSNAVWIEIAEGGISTISAPEGNEFSELVFASYGSPVGSSGNYSYGECHASASMEIVASTIIGRQSAELYANNGVFGDPCPGVYKSLYVVALFSPTPTTTTVPPTTTIPPTTTLPPTTTVPPNTTLPPTTTVPPTTVPETTVPEMTIPETTIPETTTTSIAPVIEEITPDEALGIAVSPAVLASLDSEEAAQVFEAIDVSELSEEDAQLIVNAVQNAPQEVKEAFEEEVNIYGGKFDTYVPVGSVVSVGARRALVAAGAVLSSLPAVASNASGGSGGKRK